MFRRACFNVFIRYFRCSRLLFGVSVWFFFFFLVISLNLLSLEHVYAVAVLMYDDMTAQMTQRARARTGEHNFRSA